MTAAVEVEGLRVNYATHQVLRGVSFSVEAGSVLAVLGANGAGKTTIVDVLTTRRPPGGGRGRILGLDVVHDRRQVRRLISVARQDSTVDTFLTGRENLATCARLLGRPRNEAREVSERLLAEFDLLDAADRPTSGYSGGMRRRLDLALCLVSDPRVIFLDEPTTGLDPTSRNELWHVVRQLVAAGTTVVLTTQYLEEADALADQVVLINSGVVVADGTTADLKRQIGGNDHLEVTLSGATHVPGAQRALERCGATAITLDAAQHRLTARAVGGVDDLAALIAELRTENVDVVDLALRQPSLDEVFATLTVSSTGRTRTTRGAVQ